jgi:hypothetical protein
MLEIDTLEYMPVILNNLKILQASYKVDVRRKEFREDAEFEFGSDEDAPMCLDVHPTVSCVTLSTRSSFLLLFLLRLNGSIPPIEKRMRCWC